MKRFFVRLLFFTLFGIIIFVLLDTFAKSFKDGKIPRIREVLNNSKQIEAIAVGNSHSCAMNFKELDIEGYRIAEGGNDIFEVGYQLRALVPVLENLDIVFYNISYFTFQSDNSTLSDEIAYFDKVKFQELTKNYPHLKKIIEPVEFDTYVLIELDKIGPLDKNKLGNAYLEIKNRVLDRSQIRRDLYRSLSDYRWINNDFENFFISQLSSVIRKRHWREIINEILKPDETEANNNLDQYGQSLQEHFFTFLSEDSLCFFAQNIDAARYKAVQRIALEKNPEVETEVFTEITEQIKLLSENNIRIIFYTPPYYHCFNETFDLNSKMKMKHFMKRLQNSYNIEYYDFSEDTSFSYDHTLFFNSDHLNRTGAKLFSRKFKSILSKNLN